MVVEVQVFSLFKNSHFRTIIVARSLPCGVGHVGQCSNWAFRAQHESNRYNSMIQYLGDSLEEFPGPSNQTWCFVHTINLITKSILKLFNGRKAKDLQAFNNMMNALADLNEGDEQATGNDKDKDNKVKEDEDEDEDEDNEGLQAIRLVLLKVCSFDGTYS